MGSHRGATRSLLLAWHLLLLASFYYYLRHLLLLAWHLLLNEFADLVARAQSTEPGDVDGQVWSNHQCLCVACRHPFNSLNWIGSTRRFHRVLIRTRVGSSFYSGAQHHLSRRQSKRSEGIFASHKGQASVDRPVFFREFWKGGRKTVPKPRDDRT